MSCRNSITTKPGVLYLVGIVLFSVTAAIACGPYFPSTVIWSPDSTAVAAPVADYQR